MATDDTKTEHEQLIAKLNELIDLEKASETLQIGIVSLLQGNELPASAKAALGGTPADDAKDKDKTTDPSTEGTPTSILGQIFLLLQKAFVDGKVMGGPRPADASDPGLKGNETEMEAHAREQRQARTMSAFGRAKYRGQLSAEWASQMTGGKHTRIGRAFGSVGKSLSSDSSGGPPSKLGVIAGVATVAVAGIYELGKSAADAVKAIIGWTDSALASAKQLSEVSGSMAAVFAEKDIQDMLRNMERGEATAGSTQQLVEAEAARKDAAAPLVAAIDNAQNQILAVLNQALVPMLEIANDVLKSLDQLTGLGLFKEDEVHELPFHAEMDRMREQTKEINDMGRDMMNAAKAAAGLREAVSPIGGAGIGRLPVRE